MKIFNRKNIFCSYLIALILLSVLPLNSSESALNNNYFVHIRWDYLAHFAVLLPYFFLLNKAVAFDVRTLTLLLLAFLFASFTESVQYVIPYRAFNINDLVANWIGVLLSFGLFYFISRSKKMMNFHNH